MRYRHTERKGFLIGFIDFFTAGIFLIFYMRAGLQDELDEILVYAHKLRLAGFDKDSQLCQSLAYARSVLKLKV